MSPPLSRIDVEEFLQLHAEAAIRGKRMTELRDVILPALREGCVSPADLPYCLVRKIQHRRSFDYKTPLLRIYQSVMGKKQADKHIEALEAKFEVSDVEQLLVEINREYAAAGMP